MSEEFVDYDSFFTYPKDHQSQRPENVIMKIHATQEPNISSSVGQINIYDRRRFETERYTKKSPPSLKSSYGSFYTSKPYASESEPLLNRTYNSGILYGEPIHLNRYRRTQIFLFFYIVFYVAYLIVGSICFQKLEHEIDQDIRNEFRAVRIKFLEENPGVKG